MGKHKRFQSHDGATSSGPGFSTKTAGHQHLGILVVADGIDPAVDTLTVRLQVSHNGTDFGQVKFGTTGKTSTPTVTESDLIESDQTGDRYIGYVQGHNIPIEHIRANITELGNNENDFSVDTYLYLTGWSGDGMSYNERTDLA